MTNIDPTVTNTLLQKPLDPFKFERNFYVSEKISLKKKKTPRSKLHQGRLNPNPDWAAVGRSEKEEGRGGEKYAQSDSFLAVTVGMVGF